MTMGSALCGTPSRPSPQTFRTSDGWFAYNLVTNLAQM